MAVKFEANYDYFVFAVLQSAVGTYLKHGQKVDAGTLQSLKHIQKLCNVQTWMKEQRGATVGDVAERFLVERLEIIRIQNGA